jgi:hypothetical protein
VLALDLAPESVLELHYTPDRLEPLTVVLPVEATSMRAWSSTDATDGRMPWPSGWRLARRRRSS